MPGIQSRRSDDRVGYGASGPRDLVLGGLHLERRHRASAITTTHAPVLASRGNAARARCGVLRDRHRSGALLRAAVCGLYRPSPAVVGSHHREIPWTTRPAGLRHVRLPRGPCVDGSRRDRPGRHRLGAQRRSRPRRRAGLCHRSHHRAQGGWTPGGHPDDASHPTRRRIRERLLRLGTDAGAGHSRVAPGSIVVLRVAASSNGGPGGLGPAGIVPRLTGIDVNRALALATSAGLRVTVDPIRHPVGSLVVSRQSLDPGASVTAGETVLLTIG